MTDDKLRAALKAAANMGSCSQTHHWFIARRCSEALAARAASAPDEGHAFHDEWSFQRSMSAGNAVAGKPIAANQPCFDCGVTYSKHARPAVPEALDVERLAEALDADWSAAWREVPVIGPNGVEFIEARWDKRALAEIVARKYAALSQGADR